MAQTHIIAYPGAMPKVLKIIALPLFLQSCGSPDESVIYPGASYIRSDRFASDERKAAQALSIGAVVKNDVSDPYRKAIMCSLALQALATNVESNDTIDSENLSRLQQIVSLFERRARLLAAGLGKSAGEAADDISKEDAEMPDLSTRAQVAVGCLRELSES